MSRFLQIECDPLDQPAATDPIEKATWSALRIRIGHHTVSRVIDRTLNSERSQIYVPVFGIAEWVVNNWWALLHEPCRTEFLPDPMADDPEFSWTKRHCLRSAESDLLLPALYLYNDGRGIKAEWRGDTEDDLPHMPAHFVNTGWAALEYEATEQALSQFVSDVLARTADVADERIDAARQTWRAVRDADPEERAFCIMAGRLGLDPYDAEQLPDSLATLIEQIAAAEESLASDITSAATPSDLPSQWAWVDNAKRTHRLSSWPSMIGPPPANGFLRADHFGYNVAHQFRDRASQPPDKPLQSIELLARAVLGSDLRIVHENHLVGREIKSIVGKDINGDARVVGPPASHPENERFRVARALYQVGVAGGRGPRLVTDAFTWDQRASRAFAAELLAPQQALKARAGRWADLDTIRNLAKEFNASSMLIEKQLVNAGVPIQYE